MTLSSHQSWKCILCQNIQCWCCCANRHGPYPPQLSSNLAGPFLKQVALVCPVKIFTLSKILAVSISKLFFGPSVWDNITVPIRQPDVPTICVSVLNSLLHYTGFNFLLLFPPLLIAPEHGPHKIISAWVNVIHQCKFCILRCSLLLDVLITILILSFFPWTSRIPQNGGGGGPHICHTTFTGNYEVLRSLVAFSCISHHISQKSGKWLRTY